MKYLIIEIPENSNPKYIKEAIVSLVKTNSIITVEDELKSSKCNIFDFLNVIEKSEIKDSAEDLIKNIEYYKKIYTEIQDKYSALERAYRISGDFVIRNLESYRDIMKKQPNFSQGLYDNICKSIEFIKSALKDKNE